MDLDTRIKVSVYRHFAETGRRPTPDETASRAGVEHAQVLDAYPRLRAQRVLVLEADGASIRMAPPFSGVPTQHVVVSGGVSYFANCAWDALGIVAALGRTAELRSRCEVTRDFTVAVFVVDRGRILLHEHRKLGRWLPPGGHIEPNELPDVAAQREVDEEAGIAIRLVGARGPGR